jgi:hypothetical protein
MADYILSCCSTADLAKEHFLSRDIRYICFHYELDGKQYKSLSAVARAITGTRWNGKLFFGVAQ